MIIEYKKLSAQNLAFISRGSTLNYSCGVKVEDEIERRYGRFKSRVLPEAFHFKVSKLFAAVNGERSLLQRLCSLCSARQMKLPSCVLEVRSLCKNPLT